MKKIFNLYVSSFKDDPYFQKRYKNLNFDSFYPAIKYCVKHDGIIEKKVKNQLVGFLLSFVLKDVDIHYFFGGEPAYLKTVPADSRFLMAIAVDEQFRLKGYAEEMLSAFVSRYQNLTLLGDVTNPNTLSMYGKFDFIVEPQEDYDLVIRRPSVY
jgi:GNAT superfamily N-acetyltransferase